MIEIYCGFYNSKRKHGILKIGMTGQNIKDRAAQIKVRNGGDFTIIKSIQFSGITKVEALFVESYVRLKLEQVNELVFKQKSNDHFLFEAANHKDMVEKMEQFAALVEQYARKGFELARTL